MNKKSGFRKNTLLRLLKTLFEFYPVMLPLVIVCIIFNALISSMPAIFQQNVIAIVERGIRTDPETGGDSGNPLRHFSGGGLCLYPYHGSNHPGFADEVP